MSLRLTGSVTSGFGKGKEFVTLEGYASQFENRLGYEPYPGTLNLVLDSRIDESLSNLTAIRIDGWQDGDSSFGAVDCYPATIPAAEEDVPVHLIVPDRTDHDTSTIELISPFNLRDRIGLSDETELTVSIREPETA
jgi:riboflavin kinase